MSDVHPSDSVFTETELVRDPVLRYFHYQHLSESLQKRSKPFCELARTIINDCPVNAERSVALRKLLEAKDAAVRSNV